MGSDWSDLYFKKHVMTGDLCTVMFIITVFYFVVSPVKRSYRYYKAISYFEGVHVFLFFSFLIVVSLTEGLASPSSHIPSTMVRKKVCTASWRLSTFTAFRHRCPAPHLQPGPSAL